MDVGRTARARVYAALGDPVRLAMVDRLLLADASPTELQTQLAMPSNLMAHHLGVLKGAQLVRSVRSHGDGRRTYLRLIPATLDALVPSAVVHADRVLFVCTQNSARSQLAVAIWNRRSSLPAVSAGTHPAAEIHPRALAAARRHRMPMRAHTPRHLDDVVAPTDLVIAVCDSAHEELPPDARRIHWSIPDPARAGTDAAFDQAFGDITERINRLVPALAVL